MRTFIAIATLTISVATSAGAATVGTIGSSFANDFLNANGHTASTVSSTAAELADLDTVILHRGGTGNQDLIDFVAAGGLLITEWSSSAWVLNTASLLDATDAGGGFVQTGTVISFTDAGLATDLDELTGPSFSSVGATEFFRDFTNIGSSVDILATRPGDEATILGGSFGLGSVLILGYDWQDQGYSGVADNGNEQLLLQAVTYSASDIPAPVPLPASAILLMSAVGGTAFMRRRKS
ncbi:MAG: VPLPA-CTERM sorting domain-containing protein [Pseudomonadota bacterium]